LARAKNTSRAEARRHTRELQRAELLATTEASDEAEEAADQASASASATAAPAERPRLFKLPDIRADLRALPGMFLTRKLLWLPLLLLLVGVGMTLVLPGLSADVGAIIDLYIQFFFVPPALFTFFIAGFFAPRASYLVGLLYGLLAGVMWTIVILAQGQIVSSGGAAAAPTTLDPPVVIFNMLLIGALYGTLAAAFASWYRDFLRGMQARGAARRADQEAMERAKRREERQEARRVAKRPTS
jgi:hypothetical protein